MKCQDEMQMLGWTRLAAGFRALSAPGWHEMEHHQARHAQDPQDGDGPASTCMRSWTSKYARMQHSRLAKLGCCRDKTASNATCEARCMKRDVCERAMPCTRTHQNCHTGQQAIGKQTRFKAKQMAASPMAVRTFSRCGLRCATTSLSGAL